MFMYLSWRQLPPAFADPFSSGLKHGIGFQELDILEQWRSFGILRRVSSVDAGDKITATAAYEALGTPSWSTVAEMGIHHLLCFGGSFCIMVGNFVQILLWPL